jgi:tetratricopeptide (TPR) repeat protein
MPKKKASPHRQIVARPPQSLVAGLNEAESLTRRKRWIEARELLESLDRRYPNRPEVLAPLVNANFDLKDILGYQHACERLVQLIPHDPDATLGLAGAYLLNSRPALALRTFRRFAERFPDHPRAADATKNAADLEGGMDELLSEAGLSGAEGMALAEQHEEIQSALGQGNYPLVHKLAEQLLRRKPDFAPALNNLSQAYVMQGKLEQAIAAAERVLAFDPGNVHALANLVVYHCRLGRLAEARGWADRLQRSEQPAADKELKIAEALSFLGDDEGVLEALRAAERQDTSLSNGAEALLYHLAAVAELRLGHEAAARRHWQQALKLNPGLELARQNLDDLAKPIGERHAPWPFSFGNWIARQPIDELSAQVMRQKSEPALASAMRRYLQKRPQVAALVPILLDRGDPQAREFALMVARVAQTPELAAALRDFALGQRGPDSLRHQAAQAADNAGLMPDRRARLWAKGKWQDITLMGFEIVGEPEQPFDPKVEPLARKAVEALHAGQPKEAELLLREALALEPDSPSLLNNLALAYGEQSRTAEAEALVRATHLRHPDYLFARLALARIHLRDGELDAADELITPLFMRRRLHYSEATALFAARVDLELARGNDEAARSWLDMWSNIDPDSPEVARYRAMLKGSPFGKLFGRR